jgi:hypothetical protein
MFSLRQIHWRPAIGDPSLAGWIIFIAYFVAAAAALYVFKQKSDGISRRFWFWLTLLLLFLGINKQLDLQTLLTDVGRIISRDEGWYKERRTVQLCFVISLTAVVFSAFLVVLWKLRISFREFVLLLVGLLFLLSFVIIRAASFHHVDLLTRLRISEINLSYFLELGGIGIILVESLRELVRIRRNTV